MSSEIKSQARLHGCSIFLSASVPNREREDEFERIFEAPIRIEEAVVCLARAIFAEGGTLVFGAHPSISPLVARVADDYHVPAPAEKSGDARERENDQAAWKNPSVLMYQSLVWKPYWAEASEQLARHPLVSVIWTEAEANESVEAGVKHRSQAPKSMARMRELMIEETSPVAMVAIGGMQGVLNEAEIFMRRRPQMPIFAFVTTGGAAAVLAKRKEFANQVHVVDAEAENLVRKFWNEHAGEKREGADEKRFTPNPERDFYIPYALVAQSVVAQIVEQNRPPARRADG